MLLRLLNQSHGPSIICCIIWQCISLIASVHHSCSNGKLLCQKTHLPQSSSLPKLFYFSKSCLSVMHLSFWQTGSLIYPTLSHRRLSNSFCSFFLRWHSSLTTLHCSFSTAEMKCILNICSCVRSQSLCAEQSVSSFCTVELPGLLTETTMSSE